MSVPGWGRAPDVIGLTVSAAERAARRAGSDVVVQQQQPSSYDDIVRAQVPRPGDHIRRGARLWIWIVDRLQETPGSPTGVSGITDRRFV